MNHEDEATRHIRESTREAVARFQHDPERQHTSASSSAQTVIDSDNHTARDGEGEGLEEPSQGRLKKAGMLGTIAPGSGQAAKAHLAQGSGARGWEYVEVPDKHSIWSPAIAPQRKKALKVSALLSTRSRDTMWRVERAGQ